MALPKVTLDIKIGAKEIVTLVLGIPWAYKKVLQYKARFQQAIKKNVENGRWYIHEEFDTGDEVIYGPNGEKYRREL